MDWLSIGLLVFLLAIIGIGSLNDKTARRVIRGVCLSFLSVVIVVAITYWFVNDSGWMPRTREVNVYAHASNWITGELKICTSSSTEEKNELKYLSCGSELYEIHTLTVKFWGPITTDRDKTWKCERMESSLTCKLQ
jgi:hypothetical protein